MMSRVMPNARPLAFSALLLMGGCMVGPSYHRPATPTPPAYKESGDWSPIQPSDAADRKDWWTVFNDPTLNALEARVNVSNQTLAAAEAAYREAHAIVAEDQAQLWPTVTGGADVTQSGGGKNSSSGGKTHAIYQVNVGATWAPDIWGAVRRQIRSAKAQAQASAALVASARLSAQVELAADYFTLRQLDQEKRDDDAILAADQHALDVVKNKYDAGAAARSDYLTAKSTLESATAADTDLAQQRARMEHAIAVLTGEPPAALDLPPGPWNLTVPEIPTTVPSTLLQRRPDIANAERTAAAQSEQIGIAIAAFFPNITLSGQGGFSAPNLGSLFNASSLFWSLGAQAAETIFDAGARSAKVRAARAAYDEAVANYRQTVLAAFQNVEDNMAAQKVFVTEEAQLKAADADAHENVSITLNEYQAGTADYTTVASAQVAASQARNALTQMQANRLTTAVSLVEALGGGWTTADLPKD
jgi:NodT family efflux transporter outer membrane factor (OMF) lipoprotein